MSTTTVPSTVPAPVRPVDEAQGACPACPHPVAAHDAISLRFCRATAGRADGAAARGCVCPPS